MHTSYLRAFTLGFFFMAPLLMVFSTFVMYAILGNPVVSAKVYAVLPLFYAARLCTALFLPYAIMNGTEGLVSIRRIKVSTSCLVLHVAQRKQITFRIQC